LDAASLAAWAADITRTLYLWDLRTPEEYAAADLVCWRDKPVAVLEGGTAAWAAEGWPLSTGEQACLSPRIDRYRRPYEGTDAPREAMQGYLDWECGLVAQLARDGTHGFKILPAA
jgi:3-mercaptopyruvate sulfurtransferase SseA